MTLSPQHVTFKALTSTMDRQSMPMPPTLRELQHRRVTYSIAGKGTFVHPDAFDVLRGGALREPVDDPDLRLATACGPARTPTNTTPSTPSSQNPRPFGPR